ncbi:ring-cleaving dioxygenase [Enterococcus sp. DIV0175]|uniref:ring-cleaving dioxygenase n=1 Tax=Enterococcus sp. DIV0175 TaxID=2774768 RepID=UPI003D2FAB03
MDTQIRGLHHVTAMTSSATKIYRFFTDVLGLRLAKKTVNQDDIETYHLYFTDENGAPGTDMTFFDFPYRSKGSKGTNSISRVSFRVPDDSALNFWHERLSEYQVAHSDIKERFGKKYLEFEDFDNQSYQLISDQQNHGVAAGVPWTKSNVPTQFALIGLGPVFVRVSRLENIKQILKTLLGFHETAKEGNFHQFEVGEGGNGATIIVEVRNDLPDAIEGFGNIHHLALRVADKQALRYWIQQIQQVELPDSGFIDRFYFQSEYFLASSHVLFELATDGPGFFEDEEKNHAGEKLSLPPAFEEKRLAIEEIVRPFDTSDANMQR